MRQKILLFGAGCLALLFILLVAFVLLLPYLINLDPIKEKILSTLLQQVGGKVEYQKIEPFYFPRPGVKAHQVTLSISEKVAGTVKSVQVYPELPALLRGKLRVTQIQVESPDFAIRFPMERAEVKERSEDTALEEFEEIVTRVAAIVPRLKAVIKDGKLNLLKGSETILSFNDIDANIAGPPREAKIEITCRSNLWEKMSAEAKIGQVDLNGHGHIEIVSFRPHLLPRFLSPDFPLKVTDSDMNLNINFETRRKGMFQAALEGSVSKLTFEEGGQETNIRGKRFQSAFQMEGGIIDISLGELDLEYPRLVLSGKFKMDQKAPLLLLEVRGRELDVTSTREVALRLAGKIPVINTIFDIVRGGRIPLITFQSHARRMSDLDDTERFSIKGNILDGKISIPVRDARGNKEGLSLEKVIGDVTISRGILEGRNIKAQWKNQQLQEGKLRIGLEGKDPPLHLEIGVETDLSLLPPLLNRLNKNPVFREEMARIREIGGRAVGRLVLGESLKSIEVKVDAQEVNLVSRHDRIPYPVVIVGGAFSFDGERLKIRNLSGKVGSSSFSNLTAEIGIEKDPSLQIISGSSVIFLGDLHPWFSSYEVLRDSLKEIQSMKGEVTLSDMRLSGPLMRPEKWDFETIGELKDLIVNTSFLPEPFSVSSGKFSLHPQKVTLANFQTKFLSASLNVSGALYDYQRGLERAELSLSGQVTPKDIQWLSKALGLRYEAHLRSSIGISQAQLLWRKGADVGFRGDLAVKNGPEIFLDVFRHSGGIKINNLVIRDDISNASIGLDVKGRAIDFTFSGRLAERTMDKIFSGHPFQDGWVKGDFQAHIDVDQPTMLVAHGKIEGNHFLFPSLFEKPLEIEEASLHAKENHLTVDRANFVWGGKRLALSGDVSFFERRILLDLDLFTESVDLKVDLNTAREFLSVEKKGRKNEGLQLQGTIRFKTKSLLYERFTWRPFFAEVMLDPHGAEVVVREANLCGISTLGSVKIADQNFSLDLRPFSKSEGMQSTFSCLLDQEMRVKGNFDLKGRIVAQGKPEELVSSVKGDVELQSKHGHIYYSIGLMRILEFINSTEIYRGKLPDPGKEGVEYNLLKIKADFHNGKLIIDEAMLDGTTLEIVANGEIDLMNQGLNLMVLVAPFKTVDRIVKLIPLVREILAGTLVTIPLAVHGSLKDPKVTPLSPSAIGSELLGMMKRTLGLPFKLAEPLMPRKKEKNGEER